MPFHVTGASSRKTPSYSHGIFRDTRRAYFYSTGCSGSVSAWRLCSPPGCCSPCRARRLPPAHKARAPRLAAWVLFPMSVEALTARSQGRRAARARQDEQVGLERKRSFVAVRLPRVRQVFGPGTAFRQYLALTALRIRL